MVLEVSIDFAAHRLRAKPRAPPATPRRTTLRQAAGFRAAFQPVITGNRRFEGKNPCCPTSPELEGKILSGTLRERDLWQGKRAARVGLTGWTRENNRL